MEICNECGESVKLGSGKFVNRIIDFNTRAYRRAMGKPYPEGDFICEECYLIVVQNRVKKEKDVSS